MNAFNSLELPTRLCLIFTPRQFAEGVLSLAASVRLFVCQSVCLSVRRTKLVHAITRQGFDRESPFSHRMCILGLLITLLEMGLIDLDLQGHFGLKLTGFRKFELIR